LVIFNFIELQAMVIVFFFIPFFFFLLVKDRGKSVKKLEQVVAQTNSYNRTADGSIDKDNAEGYNRVA
jgi:uncharacterized membrane protein